MIIKNKRAFTVVEIALASILFVVVCGAVYKLFSGVSTGFQRSTKSLNMQNEMRNGLNYIREEMQRASYRSQVKINGTGIISDSYEFNLTKAATISTKDAAGSASTGKVRLAEWSICKPFDNRTNTGFVYKATLHYDNASHQIIYNRTCVENGSNEKVEDVKDKVVMKGIGTININVEDYQAGNEGYMVNFEVFAYDETRGQPDLNTTAQTGAKVEVKVLREL